MSTKTICAAFIVLMCFCHVQANNVRTKRTFDLFGFLTPCGGCPPRFCDDDPAVIHGYCCGCARLGEVLPVHCSPFMACPLNTYELCGQYNYMMRCCCHK